MEVETPQDAAAAADAPAEGKKGKKDTGGEAKMVTR